MGFCTLQEAANNQIEMAQNFISLCTRIMQVKGSKLHHLMHWVCSLQLLIRDALKCTVFFSSLQAAGISNSGHVDQSIALEALQRIENRLQTNELELSELRLQVFPIVIPNCCQHCFLNGLISPIYLEISTIVKNLIAFSVTKMAIFAF